MVVCNRCGEKTESLVACSALDLRLCKVCSDAYSDWLNMQIFVPKNTEIHDLKKELAQSSKRNENLVNENTQLKATVKLLSEKLHASTETRIESVKSVADAKQVMQDEGYVFYKKPENWGKWNKGKHRKRRTKKEIEAARANEREKK